MATGRLTSRLLRQCDTNNQIVSSRTGFNNLTRNNISFFQKTLDYLPAIREPATNISTVYEVLCQAQNITKILHIEEVICVFDQALYAKAAEVIWKQPQQFSHIVLRLGVFHTICTLLAVIDKRFEEAGLRDAAIESGIIAEGSVGSVLDGKQYNRGVRLHKIIYEALMWK